MIEITSLPLLLLFATAAPIPAGGIDIKTLWNSATHARGNVFVEMRCRGLSPDDARKRIDSRFSKREADVEGVIGPPHADEILPIGRRCPDYAGSTARYDRLLREIEGYLRTER